jgi:hypothetical protein
MTRSERMWSDKGRRLIERGPVYRDQPDRPDGPDDPPESARCCVCRSIWPVRGCEFCPDGMPVGLREAA